MNAFVVVAGNVVVGNVVVVVSVVVVVCVDIVVARNVVVNVVGKNVVVVSVECFVADVGVVQKFVIGARDGLLRDGARHHGKLWLIVVVDVVVKL